MAGREAMLTAAIGQKGVGKTFKTWQRLLRYAQGDASHGLLPRKGLIVDINDEFGPNDNGFVPIRALALQDVYRFANHPKVDIRRIRTFKANGHKMTLDEVTQALFYILENFRGGVLLIEDISKYISDVIPKDVIGAICTQRHVDCDIVLHFQLINKILHPKIWGNLNLLRLHKYKGSVKNWKNEFGSSYEMMVIAETLIDIQYNRGNIYFHCYANLDNSTISGEFTEDDFVESIDMYIRQNYRAAINPLLQERDGAGALVHQEPASAISSFRDRLVAEYYGNNKR